MDFFFGKDSKKVQKIIQADFSGQIKQALRKQFCMICGSTLASKVAFGEQLKSIFTCSNCEIDAVGGVVSRLGDKNLINNDRLGEIITKQLMTYQQSNKNPPQQHKNAQQKGQNLIKKATDLSTNLSEQVKKMKIISKNKLDQLIAESQKQNSVFVFQEISKIVKDGKFNQIENGNILLKRSLIGKKGLQFSDEQTIENANIEINQRLSILKKQTKIKLKELTDLIDQINIVQL